MDKENDAQEGRRAGTFEMCWILHRSLGEMPVEQPFVMADQ
jgi:hypothetical protein